MEFVRIKVFTNRYGLLTNNSVSYADVEISYCDVLSINANHIVYYTPVYRFRGCSTDAPPIELFNIKLSDGTTLWAPEYSYEELTKQLETIYQNNEKGIHRNNEA